MHVYTSSSTYRRDIDIFEALQGIASSQFQKKAPTPNSQRNHAFAVAAPDFSDMTAVFFFRMTASWPVMRRPRARSNFAPRASLERSSALRGVGTNRWSCRRLFSSLLRPSVRCLISAMPVSVEELDVENDGEAEYVEYRFEVRFEATLGAISCLSDSRDLRDIWGVLLTL